MQGRFGNQLFQYAHGRAACEAKGIMLITAPWVGEKIFEIPETWRMAPDKCDMFLSGYFQHQKDINYTRKQVREWFKLRPEFAKWLNEEPDKLLAHRRVGDYAGSGFVEVSKRSYLAAALAFGYDPAKLVFIMEENPTRWEGFSDDISFLPDFIRLMRCIVLFRGNSTFSWWASVLGNAKTYSPVIKGLPGGKAHDCEFVLGNHPQMVDFDFTSDIHLPEG